MSNRAKGVGGSINTVSRMPKDRRARGGFPSPGLHCGGLICLQWALGRQCRAVVILHTPVTPGLGREKVIPQPCTNMFAFILF